ncbi:MAG: hypothetical protein BWY25_01216 [Chloroflexi bacterium ADurb.Bin222]|nr:MAG: hypothetical protein BWY25_01216 [Chloroflexi bacterium ADurb.Bin222]
MGLPLEACLGDEPRRHDRECQVVLPSPILARLTLIPPQLRLGILDRAFHEVALGFHVGQGFQGRVRRRIAEGVGHLAVGCAPHHQPLFRGHAVPQGPDVTSGVGALQFATRRTPDRQRLPLRFRTHGNLRHRQRLLRRQDSRLGGRFTSFGGRGYAPLGALEVNARGAGDIGHVYHAPRRQLRSKPVGTPVQVVTRHEVKRHSFVQRAGDHLPPQLHFSLERALCWNPRLGPPFGISFTEPHFRQEQFPIHPGPIRPLSHRQEHPHLTHIRLAQPTIVLARTPGWMVTCLSHGTLVQDQDAAMLPFWQGLDFLPHLAQRALRRPRRIRHEMVEVFARDAGLASYLREVAVGFHAQQAAQVMVRIFRHIPRLGPKVLSIALPKGAQALRQGVHRVAGQAPARQICQLLRNCNIVIRSSIPYL